MKVINISFNQINRHNALLRLDERQVLDSLTKDRFMRVFTQASRVVDQLLDSISSVENTDQGIISLTNRHTESMLVYLQDAGGEHVFEIEFSLLGKGLEHEELWL